MRRQFEKKCTVVAAGDFDGFAQDELGFLIAADGGLKYCIGEGKIPNLVIGDTDSLSEKNYADLLRLCPYAEVIKLPCEKDDTDTLAALSVGISRGFDYFEIYGGLGGKRLDHTLANLQCLSFLQNRGVKGVLISRTDRISLITDETVMIPNEGQEYLSVFAYGGEAQGVSIKGTEYGVENAVLTPGFPLGISNHIVATDAVITVEKGSLLILEHR